MPTSGQPYVSGNWMVKEGSEDEFILRWTEFTGWSQANMAGAQGFTLLRQVDDPRHFVSFGSWQTREQVDAWRSNEGFQQRLARCRELCDDFAGTDFTVASAVQA
jgi:heme-degrading monooxygenase HmoA